MLHDDADSYGLRASASHECAYTHFRAICTAGCKTWLGQEENNPLHKGRLRSNELIATSAVAFRDCPKYKGKARGGQQPARKICGKDVCGRAFRDELKDTLKQMRQSGKLGVGKLGGFDALHFNRKDSTKNRLISGWSGLKYTGYGIANEIESIYCTLG